METYWDLEPHERADLTEEQVKSYLDVELMKAGVGKPRELVLLDESKPEVAEHDYFEPRGVSRYGSDNSFGIAFATPEQAAAFWELEPLSLDLDYSTDQNVARLNPQRKTVTTKACDEQEHARLKADLERWNENKNANSKARALHSKTAQEASEAVSGVWGDWREQLERHIRLDGVRDTFDEYLELCKGDRILAAEFLLKVHSMDLCTEALPDVAFPVPSETAATEESDEEGPF